MVNCFGKGAALALVLGGLALGGMTATPASADDYGYRYHHRYHDRYRHSHRVYGYRDNGYRDRGYGYGGPGCIPAVGLLSGDYCGY